MTDLLQIDSISGGYTQTDKILDGISLSLKQGSSIGIIGLNGCGKSTLGKALMNMLPYREGSVFLSGQSISSLNTRDIVKRGMTMMFQGGRVFNGISVKDNIKIATKSQRNGFIEELKAIIPLLSIPQKELMIKADCLSGGLRHQLALAMVLATAPKIVILDEPGAGLSPRALEEMYGILKKLITHTGISIILIDQNISRAISFCDRTYLLDSGKIVKDFTQQDVEQTLAYFF